jgi:hypothetical protein
LSITTMLAACNSPPTRFIISERIMWRSTCTLSLTGFYQRCSGFPCPGHLPLRQHLHQGSAFNFLGVSFQPQRSRCLVVAWGGGVVIVVIYFLCCPVLNSATPVVQTAGVLVYMSVAHMPCGIRPI